MIVFLAGIVSTATGAVLFLPARRTSEGWGFHVLVAALILLIFGLTGLLAGAALWALTGH